MGACRVIEAADIAAKLIEEIKDDIASRKEAPLLVGFLANDDPAARKYAEWTNKTCQATGIRFELREFTRMNLEDEIVLANSDASVHGIMVYYPVFGIPQDRYLQNTVSVKKDVEGLSHSYRYNLYHNIRYLDDQEKQKCIIPCTPLAIIKILEFIGAYNPVLPHGNRLYGRTITIINRSEVVGRPLAAMLANDGAKVFSVDIHDIFEFHRGQGLNLKKHEVFETKVTREEALRCSGIVISGVPANLKVPTKDLKDGVMAINFSSFKNFEEEIQSKASIFVPSVGKVTVAMLQRNLLRLQDYGTSK